MIAFTSLLYGCASSPHITAKRQPDIGLDKASSHVIIALNTKVDYIDMDTHERMEAPPENALLNLSVVCGANTSIFLYNDIHLPGTQIIPLDCDHHLLNDVFSNLTSYMGGYLNADSTDNIRSICESSSTQDVLLSHLTYKVGHDFFLEPVFGHMSPNTNSTVIKFTLIGCHPISIKWRAQLLIRGAAELEEINDTIRLLFY